MSTDSTDLFMRFRIASNIRPENVDVVPNEVRVFQREGKHDIAVVTFSEERLPFSTSALRTGSPVIVAWGRGVYEPAYFFGYVHNVGLQTTTSVRVLCVGTSYPLKHSDQYTFPMISVPQVFRRIARVQQLNAVVDSHNELKSRSQSGESVWQFLLNISNEIGYKFYVNQSTLYLIDPDKLLSQRYNEAPIFYKSTSTNKGTIRSFSRVEGLNDTGTNFYDRVIYGTDPYLYDEFSTTTEAEGGFVFIETGTIAESIEEGNQILVGQQRRNAWGSRAKAQLRGITHFTQFSPVCFEGLGILNDGLWIATEVEHIVVPGDYVMNVALAREGTGDNGVRPLMRSNRRVVYSGNDSIELRRQKFPPTVLVNGQWRSAWEVADAA